MQLLRGLRIFGVHVHHEVGVCGEQRHLPLRVATVGTVRVGLNELPDRETVGGFRDGDRDMLAHEISSDLEDGTSFEKRLDPIPAVFAADPGVFESTPGGLRIVSHAIDHDAPGPNLRGNPARTLKVFSDDAGVKAISGVVAIRIASSSVSWDACTSIRASRPTGAAMSTSSKSNPPPSALRTSAFTSGLLTDAAASFDPGEAVCAHVALPVSRILRSPLRR